MTLVVLVQVQDDVGSALRSLEAGAAPVSFREIEEGQLLRGDADRAGFPDVLVLGDNTREPIRIAQRVHTFETDPPVLILSEDGRLPLLRRAVQFAPFLGNDVTCLPSSEKQAVLHALGDAVSRVNSRRSYRSTVDALNVQLAQSSPPRARRVHLDRLLDSAPLGVMAMDSRGSIVSWNPRAALYFAMDERAAIGQPVSGVFSGPGAGRIRALHEACLRGDEPPLEIVERPALTGICEYVEITATPIEGASGEIGALLLLQDVTDRVRTERRLAEARAQLLAHEQAARAAAEQERDRMKALEAQKDEFLSSIAHDLRTPLTSIRGWSQVLRRYGHEPSRSPNRVQDISTRIEEGTSRLTRLIDELLDVANVQLDRPLVLQATQVDIVQLLRTLATAHGAAASRHHIAVETSVEELNGEWDAARLERVFGNILSNAVKFSPEGGEVVIRVDRSGAWAEVRISDPGIGIPPDDLPHVFERFRRGANAIGAIYGTGIGLATAHEIVTRHGGSIDIESVLGQGSTFTVRLPLAPASVQSPG